MTHTNDGGPAFPITTDARLGEINHGRYGMTLRDYFAAKAMPEVIAHLMTVRATMIKPGQFNFDEVGDTSYQIAAAMLRARAK